MEMNALVVDFKSPEPPMISRDAALLDEPDAVGSGHQELNLLDGLAEERVKWSELVLRIDIVLLLVLLLLVLFPVLLLLLLLHAIQPIRVILRPLLVFGLHAASPLLERRTSTRTPRWANDWLMSST